MRAARPATILLWLTALAVAGCGRDEEMASLRSELAVIKKANGYSEQSLGALREAYASALNREANLHARIKEAKDTIAKMELEKIALEEMFKKYEERLGEIDAEIEAAHQKHQKEMDALREEFEEYKRTYRVSLRLDARGTELENLEYAGIVYLNPVVLLATPAAIDIRHESGIARLDFAHLSSEIRDRFGYHPGEAAEYQRRYQEKENDNLVVRLAAQDMEDEFEIKTNLRIIYKAWENKVAKAKGYIQRKEYDIKTKERELKKTPPKSFNRNRLINDIKSFKRDLVFLRRDLRDIMLEEPFNPDAD